MPSASVVPSKARSGPSVSSTRTSAPATGEIAPETFATTRTVTCPTGTTRSVARARGEAAVTPTLASAQRSTPPSVPEKTM